MGNITRTPPPLQADEEDVLVTYLALIVLTLEQLGVQQQTLPPTEQQRQGEQNVARSEYLSGIADFVSATLRGYDSGNNLASVGGLQALVRQVSVSYASLCASR